MVKHATEVFHKWISVSGAILGGMAIVLALTLNAQQNAQTADNLKQAKIARCLDSREGKARTLKMVSILKDLDIEQDGNVSATTLEFLRRVEEEYKVLRSCKALGLHS